MSDGFTTFPTISGGLPTSIDLGPSILFTILYAIDLPLSIYRLVQARRPARLILTYIRLVLFTAIRVATFILRAISAKQYTDTNPVPNIGIFIAEQVLLGIGFIILVGVLLEFVKSHLANPDAPIESRPNLDRQARGLTLGRIIRLMHLALLAAIALGIAAGANYYQATQNASTASEVRTERIVSTAISLAVTALCLLISLFAFVAHPLLPRISSVYLIITSAILVIVPAYRLASTLNQSTSSFLPLISTTTKVEFWVLQATMEWIVTTLLMAVDARRWFGVGGEEARALMVGRGKEMPMSMDSVNGNQNGSKPYQNPGYQGNYA